MKPENLWELAFLLFLVLAVPCLRTGINGQETEDDVNQVAAVSKCCYPEMIYGENKSCVASDIIFDPKFTDAEPTIVDIKVGLKCEFGMFMLRPLEDETDSFELLFNGSLYLPKMIGGPQLVELGSYCLETTFDPELGASSVAAFLCFPEPNESESIELTIYPIGCSISVPFLLVTAAIFAFIKELNDLRGKVIAHLTFCLACAFICLSIVQTQGTKLAYEPCVIIAFFLQFFFLSSFFWMNVLCYDTWWKTKLGSKRKPTTVGMEKKRYVYYVLYGWSMPILIVVISITVNSISSVSSSVKPNFGETSCWFKSDLAAAIYFYIPVGAVLLLNLIFFLLITRMMYKKQERSGETGGDIYRNVWNVIMKRRMQKFKESLTLFCVMGLTWILEVISWLGPTQLWILTDILNTLQGPILFYLFVFRNKRARTLTVDKFLKCRRPEEVEERKVLPPQELVPMRKEAAETSPSGPVSFSGTVAALMNKNNGVLQS